MDRTNFLKGITADLHEWYWEAADDFYKTSSPAYKKIVTLDSTKSIKGPYAQITSGIAPATLPEVNPNSEIPTQDSLEGWVVYAKVRKAGHKIMVPYELQRDFTKVRDFLRSQIEENAPQQIENTKSKIVADLFNYGGFTAGHSIFNQDIPGILSTGYGNYVYDGKPFFNLSGNLRTAKNGATYYNGAALALTFDNLVTMSTLMTGTNAKREDGTPFDNSKGRILLVPPSLELTAMQLVNSTLIPGSPNNDVNPLKGAMEVVVCPDLTDTDAWFIVRKEGIKFWVSEPRMKFWTNENNESMYASVMIDYAICVKNWRCAVGSNFATA